MRKVVAFMPIFGRPEITGFSLSVAKRIRGVDHLIVVGSTAEDRETARLAEVEYHNHENLPLGLKWQHGFHLALEAGADKILFLGSDDWWEPGLIKSLGNHDAPLIAPFAWNVVDLDTRQRYLQYFSTIVRRNDGAGTGRLYDADFIREKLDGVLYEADAPFRGMDHYATKKILKAGGLVKTSTKAIVCQLKAAGTKEQVWRLNELTSSPNIITSPMPDCPAWMFSLLQDWDEWVRKTSR